MTATEIAEACHEANKVLCVALFDYSQVLFYDAPEWQRESIINGVKFNLENPDAPASASHENWLAEKRATGWKYGPIKSELIKEHPCCMPYDQLPKEQQAKDHLFKAIVAALSPLYEEG